MHLEQEDNPTRRNFLALAHSQWTYAEVPSDPDWYGTWSDPDFCSAELDLRTCNDFDRPLGGRVKIGDRTGPWKLVKDSTDLKNGVMPTDQIYWYIPDAYDLQSVLFPSPSTQSRSSLHLA